MAEGRFVISRIAGNFVVTLEGAAEASVLAAISENLADLHAKQGAEGVVIEVSGCEVMDLGEFAELQKLVRTMEWLGLPCVVAGLKPGIVAYLASAGVSASAFRTSLDLDLALQELEPSDEPESQPDNDEPDDEPDDETYAARPL